MFYDQRPVHKAEPVVGRRQRSERGFNWIGSDRGRDCCCGRKRGCAAYHALRVPVDKSADRIAECRVRNTVCSARIVGRHGQRSLAYCQCPVHKAEAVVGRRQRSERGGNWIRSDCGRGRGRGRKRGCAAYYALRVAVDKSADRIGECRVRNAVCTARIVGRHGQRGLADRQCPAYKAESIVGCRQRSERGGNW